jgi:hypothetical protein
MNDATGGSIGTRPRPIPAIFVGGFIVGVIDLLYAIVVYSPNAPILVPQTIAGGLLGPDRAYGGGMQTAMLGVVLHFVIACGAAAIYYLASRKLAFLTSHPIVAGMVFGALVYGFMHTVVVPFSALPPSEHPRRVYQLAEYIEHWFCVGLPIAFSVRYYSR